MNGTGVTAPPGNIRAGILVTRAVTIRDALQCSTTRIIDWTISDVMRTGNSSVKEVKGEDINKFKTNSFLIPMDKSNPKKTYN